MANDKYNIILGGQIDESKINKQILSIAKTEIIFTNIKFDTTNIKAQLENVVKNFNSQISSTMSNITTMDTPNLAKTSINAKGVQTNTFKSKGDIFDKAIIERGGEIVQTVLNYESATNRANKAIEKANQKQISDSEKINRQLEKTISNREKEAKTLEQNQAKAANKAIEKQGLQNIRDTEKYNNVLANTTETVSKANIKEKQRKNLLEQINAVEKNNNLTLEQKNKALSNVNGELKKVEKSSEKSAQSIGNMIGKFTQWYLIGGLVTGLIRAFKNVVSQVKEMDKALVELNKVSDLTAKGLEITTAQAFQLGRETARMGSEVLSAVTEFKRAGYELQNSFDLARVAITLTNVAEGITDTATASTYLIGILKGANLEINQAGYLLDQLNKISNTQAIGFDNLAEMTRRIAGTMHIFGNSIEETMGLITGSFEVLQDERVARGISTIAARLAGMNEDLEKQEGLASSVADAFLKFAGINVMDVNGQLRSTYDILKELSGEWKNLTKNQQTFLMSEAAGKQRSDVFASIMTNFKGVEKSIESANDAFGSAEEEQSRYLKSIEGKSQAVKNSFQELATITLESGTIKFIVDLLNGIIKVSTAIGGLVPTLVLVGSLILGIKASIGFFKAANLAKRITSTATAITAVGASATVASKGVLIFQASLGALMLVIGAVWATIEGLNTAREKELQNSHDAAKRYSDEADELERLKTEYIDLSNKTNINERDTLRLEAIKNQLIKTYGDEAKALDFLNGKYDENSAKMREFEKSNLDKLSKANEKSLDIIKEQIGSKQTMTNTTWETFFGGINSFDLAKTKSEIGKTLSSELNLFKDDPIEKFKAYEKAYESLLKKQKSDKLTFDEKKILKTVRGEVEEQRDLMVQYNNLLKEQEKIEAKLKLLGDKNLSAGFDDLKKELNGFLKLPIDEQAKSLEIVKKIIDDYVIQLKEKGLYEDYKEEINSITEAFREQAEVVENTDFAIIAMEKEMIALEKKQKLEEEALKLAEQQKELAESEQKIEEKKLDIAQKEIAIEKASEALARAKESRTLRVYRQGKGFVYIQDQQLINEAQLDLDKAREELASTKEDLKKLIEELEKKQTEILGTETEKAMKELEKLMEVYNQAILDGVKVNDETLREYFLNADNLANYEKLNYQERLKMLKQFLNEKNQAILDDSISSGKPPDFVPPSSNIKTFKDSGSQEGKYADVYSGKNKQQIAEVIRTYPHRTTSEEKENLKNLKDFMASDYDTYHEGGFVGGKAKTTNVIDLKTNERFSKLLEGEYVATAQMQKNAVRNFDFINNTKSGDTFITNISKIELPNVNDSNQFIKEVKNISLRSPLTTTNRK